MGVTFLAIAPDHPLAVETAKHNAELANFIDMCRHTKVAEADLATQPKKAFPLPIMAIHPLTQEKLPVWVTNFVLMEYGQGAIMAVPAHDARDFEVAKQYQLPIKPVIHPSTEWDFNNAAYTGAGVLFDSGVFNGLNNETAKSKITEYLVEQQLGEKQINYRLRDWGISRQRYWGTPIPIVYCKKCGACLCLKKNYPWFYR